MKMRYWVERPALERCPLSTCRRSGTCRHNTPADPCRRTHQTRDAMYNSIANTLDRLTAEAKRRDPEGKNFAPEGSPEFERRYSALYRALREREEDASAAGMAERATRRAPKEKPATLRKGA
ncbi:hypothetical protein [Aestuariivirga sp.]|uniref:hypothetical protein n=1 Tax=Aestuariivirga sp. TaxID=2650926 RepID=UPI0035B4C1BA